MFSIVIPSWNNLAYLKLCVESIRKHSQAPHEIIVHLNQGTDGSLEWVQQQGIKYTHSEHNVGVCLAVNHLFAQASHDWVMFMNDDMVAAPGWDSAFEAAIQAADSDMALFYGRLLEPNGGAKSIIRQNFGETPETFNEAAFLQHYLDELRGDERGRCSQPTLVHKKWWFMAGGYSLEFSPGMSSDDDLIMKFWVMGCRHYQVVDRSRFYHFGCKSTTRIKHNHGGRVFVSKWGITQLEFYRQYFEKLGQADFKAPADNPDWCVRASTLGKIRRVGYALSQNIPLEDIEAWQSKPAAGRWTQGN